MVARDFIPDITDTPSITDLTGTTWVLNDKLLFTFDGASAFDFNINFISNGIGGEYEYIRFLRGESDPDYYGAFLGDSYIYVSDGDLHTVVLGVSYETIDGVKYFILDEYYRYIKITGGTDVTNTDLIAWLQDNATLQETTTYTITANILNGTASSSNPTEIDEGGTATLTFTANEGYELPETISFYGADYTWDKSTGTLTINNPTDNINCVITCSQIISYPKINAFTYYGKQIRYINEKPIRYVHYNGNTYEMVYATFIEPTVTGSKITIEQAYSATQDGNTLIIE